MMISKSHLLVWFTRLTEQKGIDLIRDKLEGFIANGTFRFILLGSGNREYEDFFNYMKYKYPKMVFATIGYNSELSHRIMAGSDYLLLPSRFEPCGLTQMYALKYGTIPIVRQTGGLADTVKEYNNEKGKGNGFVFLHYYSEDYAYAMRRAMSIYNVQPHWDIIRRNAMKSEYSSGKSALEYLKVFKWALEKVR